MQVPSSCGSWPSPSPLPLQVTLRAIDISGLDASALVLWLMAVGTLVWGSLWAGCDYALGQRVSRNTDEVGARLGGGSRAAGKWTR